MLALCGFGAFLFLTTQYLQDTRGLAALAAGLCLLPMGTLAAVLSPTAGRLVGTRGPRLPLLVVSPYAKENYVSHTLTDQTSILRFIEDNWLNGERISTISFDRFAGPLDDMFDFAAPLMRRVLLDPATGLRKSPRKVSAK